MIIKVDTVNGFTTIDGIKEITVTYPFDSVIAYAGLFNRKHRLGLFKVNLPIGDVKEIDMVRPVFYDRFLFKESFLLDSIKNTKNSEDLKEADRSWNYKLLVVEFKDILISTKHYIVLEELDVFVLNDNGKTIDKY